ncbi:unnamed protein product [Adineta ricciae]|uniref:G-protein coupled receptors family 1 profile domain-containing protein n=1 Tax=Adineta ricciae TaxID=249248 RepID=A0A815XVI0_ADIRI|nr:unnamed protein product [Adineta ricciae]CAF1562115.1 unnamed protein product [Adineta ricciae]
MCNSTIAVFDSVTQQTIIYFGFSLFILGLIGNLLTLLVFLSLETFRQNSCAFYLTIMSFINTFHLFTGLLTFIMINGFKINWTDASVAYCKFRAFYIQTCAMISLSCMCLATVDQFLATQSNRRWHRFNSIKVARSVVTGIAICVTAYCIPFLVYRGHTTSSSTGQAICDITNNVFASYRIFHNSFLAGIIPLLIMSIFGLLAYRNVQQIAYRTIPLVRRELDKQLTSMVLIQIFYNVLAITPSLTVGLYYLILDKTLDACSKTILNILLNLLAVIYYFYYVVRFILYLRMCIEKIPSSTDLRIIYSACESFSPTQQSNQTRSTVTPPPLNAPCTHVTLSQYKRK